MPNSFINPLPLEVPITDQYADGKAAQMWAKYIGDNTSRTSNYKDFLVSFLRKNGCKRILDVACGTGVDSIMLLEEGFEVTSIDGSDKMLKHALRSRWRRRKEPAFDNWVIEEANWTSLTKDLGKFKQFDAVICLGNSFAHMLDTTGDQENQRLALKNFEECLKPGGILLIDHRNFDHMLSGETAPPKSIYYSSSLNCTIKTYVTYISNKPRMITLDYFFNETSAENTKCEFKLFYHPHRLHDFSKMLHDTFGKNSKETILADFKPLDEVKTPGYYIHLVKKH
uniref:Glycine N-methyltransferase n=1 Tax=Clastoptera arizonana TaxID=38151 RepID=A0A1B6CFW0_9HEMI